MVRQYVGARYVPKFADPVAWASGTSYEAMTIVTYNNSSYTSKIPVPATVGNPADNPDYWALTGNYNAQVEQYRQETETVSNNLITLQGQITTEITNLKNADTTLQGQITTEITNRKNADTTLQDNIDAEASARQTANNILEGNINSEAATRASADSNLQSQIDQIIAPSGEAPSAAEIQNARIGADGVTYDTLGNAIRGQVTDLKSDLSDITLYQPNLYDIDNVEYGIAWNGTANPNRARIQFDVFPGNAYILKTSYSGSVLTAVEIVEKTAKNGKDVKSNKIPFNTETRIVAAANTKVICIQIDANVEITQTELEQLSVSLYAAKTPVKETYVIPEQFGAIGNGKVDDTQAIKNAVAYGLANKIPCVLTSRYLISDTIVLRTQVLRGTGGDTGLINNTNKYSVLLMANGATIKDFSIYGNYGVQFGDWNTRVQSCLCDHISCVESLVGFYHPSTGGYNKMIDCNVSSMKDNGMAYVIGALTADAGEARLVSTNYVYIIRCTASSAKRWESSNTYGVYIAGCQFLWIDHCDIVGMQRSGIYIPEQRTEIVSDVLVTKTSIFSCARCITMVGNTNDLLYNINFVSCQFGLNIGYISANEDSRIVNIGFYQCQYITTGEEQSLGISKATLYLSLVSRVNRLDITGIQPGSFKESVTGYTTGRILRYQETRRTVDTSRTRSIVYGSGGSLEPIGTPIVIADSGIVNVNKTENANGTWTIDFPEDIGVVEVI